MIVMTISNLGEAPEITAITITPNILQKLIMKKLLEFLLYSI